METQNWIWMICHCGPPNDVPFIYSTISSNIMTGAQTCEIWVTLAPLAVIRWKVANCRTEKTEYDIKIELREVDCKGGSWMKLAQDHVHWLALVFMVNLHFNYQIGWLVSRAQVCRRIKCGFHCTYIIVTDIVVMKLNGVFLGYKHCQGWLKFWESGSSSFTHHECC
jgi:hypothetical protein